MGDENTVGELLTHSMPGGTADIFVAGSHGPGVLLYMDAIGLRPQIESIAERIASWGYVVLAPNVFWRDGRAAELAPSTDLRLPNATEEFLSSGPMRRVQGLTAEQTRSDADVWIDTLRSRVGDDSPIAVVGYCFGGRLALCTAAHRPADVAVAGMFHTGGIVTDSPDSPHHELSRTSAFLLAGHADADPSNTPQQIGALDDALQAAGVPHRTAVYPGAAHGFTMADTSRYQEAGSERHFTELQETLTAHLPGTDRGRVLTEIARRLVSKYPGHPLRVGIDGICGVGKSTFARDLQAAVNRLGRPAILVDSDGFHHVRERRYRQGRNSARGYYEDAYDFDALAEHVLRPLGPGGNRRYALRVHDLVSDAVISDEFGDAPEDAVVIFDATFIQRGALRSLWDEVVHLHSDEAAATARGVRRDAAALGGPEAARSAYESRYLAACRIYLAEEDPAARATILVDHTDPSSPAMLTVPGTWQAGPG